MRHFWILLSDLLLLNSFTSSQEAKLLRFPAVNGSQVVFCYAGDLYTVSPNGGLARKLTSHQGYETFPRFSHDGRQIAFTGQDDGNTEVFIIPSAGGEPKRITYSATLDRDDIADRMGPNNIVMGYDQSAIYRERSTSFNPFKGKLCQAHLSVI